MRGVAVMADARGEQRIDSEPMRATVLPRVSLFLDMCETCWRDIASAATQDIVKSSRVRSAFSLGRSPSNFSCCNEFTGLPARLKAAAGSAAAQRPAVSAGLTVALVHARLQPG